LMTGRFLGKALALTLIIGVALSIYSLGFYTLDGGNTLNPYSGGPTIPNVEGVYFVRPMLVDDIREYISQWRFRIVPLATIESTSPGLDRGFGGDYSETNVQVPGVDEPDFVKTDGRYIYVSRFGDGVGYVHIVDAGDFNIVSTLSFESENPVGIFIQNDLLVVITVERLFNYIPYVDVLRSIMYTPRTWVYIYDVSDRANPHQRLSYYLEGSYMDARIYGGHLYLFIWTSIFLYDSIVLPPRVELGNGLETILDYPIVDADGGRHIYEHWGGVSIASVRLVDGASSLLTVLTGSRPIIYFSGENIFMASQSLYDVGNESGGDMEPGFMRRYTEVVKLRVFGLELSLSNTVVIPGWVRSRMNIDEYRGFLRVATWEYDIGKGGFVSSIYVFSSDMSLAGYVTGMGVGEQLYGVRFIEDYAYLVTFRIIDPFYVVDLSDPYSPRILGELKVTGFSTILQPLGSSLVLGIGYNADENGRVDGIKISIYNVSNPINPVEVSRLVGFRGYSEALYDIRGMTIDWDRGIVWIPFIDYESGRSIGYIVVKVTIYDAAIRMYSLRLDSDDQAIPFKGDVRILFIGDNLFLVSRIGILTLNMDTLEVVNLVSLI